MSEANEGCALLEDLEESTFIRFSQFAYTGEYIAADPEILLDFTTIACPSTRSKPSPFTKNYLLENVSTEEDPFGLNTASTPAEADIREPAFGSAVQSPGRQYPDIWFPPKKTKKKNKELVEWEPLKRNNNLDEREGGAPQSRKERLWKLFVGRTYTVSTLLPFSCRENREPCEDYTDVFLCHARLYVFADKWDIGPLKQLSLYKLHQTLSVFTLYKKRVGDIVTLIRYSYENTPHLSSTEDPLRSLLIHYATCVVEALVQSPEFKALLEEARELASDLMVKMVDRLD